MQRVLEKIIRNYEQTEQRLLRLQEEGTKPVAHTKILCINITAISQFFFAGRVRLQDGSRTYGFYGKERFG